jgi:hypothetical protein
VQISLVAIRGQLSALSQTKEVAWNNSLGKAGEMDLNTIGPIIGRVEAEG